MDNIVLIGMPGAGKSTVGVLCAKALGYAFLDTDLVIQAREGALLQALVDTLGVEGFLDAEAQAVRSVLCRRTVVAPGGSAVLRSDAAQHLKTLGKVVYLRLSPQGLERRLHNIKSRGIAMAPGQTIADLYAQRAPLYQRYADVTVDVEGQTLEETVSAVLCAVGRDSSQGFMP